jgi:DNA-binding SARP family transcriptional activator
VETRVKLSFGGPIQEEGSVKRSKFSEEQVAYALRQAVSALDDGAASGASLRAQQRASCAWEAVAGGSPVPDLANVQNPRDTILSPTPGALIPPRAPTDKPVAFRLVTLGRLALINEHGDHLIPPESARLLGTLAYLEASPARRATRDELIAIMWDHSDAPKARNALRQLLHRLREVLGDVIGSDDDTGDITLGRELASDRERFLVALNAGHADVALAYYRGPFAHGANGAGSGRFDEWVTREREQLHRLYAAAIQTVAQRLLAAGDARAVRALTQRLLEVDPSNETAWRMRLDADAATGNPAGRFRPLD